MYDITMTCRASTHELIEAGSCDTSDPRIGLCVWVEGKL